MKTAVKKKPRDCKTYRVRIGRLADGREAFAKAGYCISALGDYRFVEVWVRDPDAYSGMKIYRERNYAAPGSPVYREMFALIVKGKDKRLPGMMPIRLAQRLGWSSPRSRLASLPGNIGWSRQL